MTRITDEYAVSLIIAKKSEEHKCLSTDEAITICEIAVEWNIIQQ